MSRSMRSPGRIPASNRSLTMSRRVPSALTSSMIFGCLARKRANNGSISSVATGGGTVMRSCPAGVLRKSLTESRTAWKSSSTGLRRARSRSPASVGATLRVVRFSRRTPSFSSSPRMVSLNLERETPSCSAALAKLRCAATSAKALISASSARIGLNLRTGHSDYTGYANEVTGPSFHPREDGRRRPVRRTRAMSSLLLVTSSLFGEASQSSRIARELVAALRKANPDMRVVERDLTSATIPHLSNETLTALATPAERRTLGQVEAAAFADALIAEVEAADTIVLAVPMYNFSIPSTLKAWLDHIVRSGRTFRYTGAGPEG